MFDALCHESMDIAELRVAIFVLAIIMGFDFKNNHLSRRRDKVSYALSNKRVQAVIYKLAALYN